MVGTVRFSDENPPLSRGAALKSVLTIQEPFIYMLIVST